MLLVLQLEDFYHLSCFFVVQLFYFVSVHQVLSACQNYIIFCYITSTESHVASHGGHNASHSGHFAIPESLITIFSSPV